MISYFDCKEKSCIPRPLASIREPELSSQDSFPEKDRRFKCLVRAEGPSRYKAQSASGL